MTLLQTLLIEAEDNQAKIDAIQKKIQDATTHYQMGDKHSGSESADFNDTIKAYKAEITKLGGNKNTGDKNKVTKDPQKIKNQIAELEAKATEMEKTLPPKHERGTDEQYLQKMKYAKVKGDIIILKRSLK